MLFQSLTHCLSQWLPLYVVETIYDWLIFKLLSFKTKESDLSDSNSLIIGTLRSVKGLFITIKGCGVLTNGTLPFILFSIAWGAMILIKVPIVIVPSSQY